MLGDRGAMALDGRPVAALDRAGELEPVLDRPPHERVERLCGDVRGGEETFAQLQRLYALLGAEENIALFTGPTEHGYSKENREAMYRFFNGVTKISDADSEPALTIEEDAALYCTPRGQVSELGSRTVMSFTREASQRLRIESDRWARVAERINLQLD